MHEFEATLIYNGIAVNYVVVKYSSEVYTRWMLRVDERFLPKTEAEFIGKLNEIGQFYTLHLN